MLGFSYMNPAVMSAVLNWSTYAPFTVKDASPESLAEVEKHFREQKTGKYRPLAFVLKLETVRALQQWKPAFFKHAIICVFDVPDVLAKAKDVTIVDAAEEKGAWVLRRVDLDEAFAGATFGFGGEEEEDQIPAKAPDDLDQLFEALLQVVPEKKRGRAGSYIAARIEGIFDKEDWLKGLQAMEKMGLDPELVRGAMRVLKENGKLAKLREASSAILAGSSHKKAALTYGVSLADLAWLDQNWPLKA